MFNGWKASFPTQSQARLINPFFGRQRSAALESIKPRSSHLVVEIRFSPRHGEGTLLTVKRGLKTLFLAFCWRIAPLLPIYRLYKARYGVPDSDPGARRWRRMR